MQRLASTFRSRSLTRVPCPSLLTLRATPAHTIRYELCTCAIRFLIFRNTEVCRASPSKQRHDRTMPLCSARIMAEVDFSQYNEEQVWIGHMGWCTACFCTASLGRRCSRSSCDNRPQVRMMEEMCIVVDDDDKALRPESKKNCMQVVTSVGSCLAVPRPSEQRDRQGAAAPRLQRLPL